jgi:hypothetical protein
MASILRLIAPLLAVALLASGCMFRPIRKERNIDQERMVYPTPEPGDQRFVAIHEDESVSDTIEPELEAPQPVPAYARPRIHAQPQPSEGVVIERPPSTQPSDD